MPRTLTCQDPLSMGFSRQEYWGGSSFSSPSSKLSLLLITNTVANFICYGCIGEDEEAKIVIRIAENIPGRWYFNRKSMIRFNQSSSVQFSCSVISDSLRPHELQHARPPCSSPSPVVHSDSRLSSPRCHPAISSSVIPFSSCPNPSQHQSLFQWVNSSHEVAKVLEFQL